LYIIFNRYAAIFFLFLTLFNCLVLVPIYVTGSPSKREEVEDKEHQTIVIALLTSINISGNPAKQVAVFVMMMVTCTAGAFLLMFFYWQKSMQWRYRNHSHQEPFYD
jgi:Late exocytosis, associated with Golgi transport